MTELKSISNFRKRQSYASGWPVVKAGYKV